MGDGSMRDALSLLDQCIAFYFGETLTYDKVLEVLGAVDIEVFARLLDYIINSDVTGCMILLEELIIGGRELSQFTVDFTWYLRNLLLVKTSKDATEAVDVTKDNMIMLKNQSEKLDVDRLIRYIRIFSELSNQIKYASQKRVMVEVALIKLCKPQMENNYEDILNRLKLLEEKLESGNIQVKQNVVDTSVTSVPKEEKPAILPQAVSKDLTDIAKDWNNIVAGTSLLTKAALTNARPSVGNNNMLLLVFEDSMDKELVSQELHMKELKDIIRKRVQKEVEIQTKLLEQGKESIEDIPDLRHIFKDITIEYED